MGRRIGRDLNNPSFTEWYSDFSTILPTLGLIFDKRVKINNESNTVDGKISGRLMFQV